MVDQMSPRRRRRGSQQRCDCITSRFTDPSSGKYVFYLASALLLLGAAVVSAAEPFLSVPCDPDQLPPIRKENVDASADPCTEVRQPKLGYMTPAECMWVRRILSAAFLCACIGYERRSPDRPAGVRTMMCVGVAAALFAVNSQLAFMLGPMDWDSARVSAALPAGVGFLGAGVIWKQTKVDGVSVQKVNGLTTAASLWMSAAVGLAAGGGLFMNALFTTLLTVNLLRFGPRAAHECEEAPAQSSWWPAAAAGVTINLYNPNMSPFLGQGSRASGRSKQSPSDSIASR
eukprot:TRINITY_DN20465_c0_g1_i1.p2 TRINITY_DN20465_c0_g1~~TRINITY_DN20465_c0_g1_i1.p2  ORF type:complete len:317 (+),score=101.55 TRINITY_DN20465_c0_g1_i1:88-951(+)